MGFLNYDFITGAIERVFGYHGETYKMRNSMEWNSDLEERVNIKVSSRKGKTSIEATRNVLFEGSAFIFGLYLFFVIMFSVGALAEFFEAAYGHIPFIFDFFLLFPIPGFIICFIIKQIKTDDEFKKPFERLVSRCPRVWN